MTPQRSPENEAPPAPKQSRARHIALNAGLTLASLVIFAAIAEPVLRSRYAHMFYSVRPEVAAIQQHLQLDPEIGFTWKPNLRPDQNIVLTVGDATLDPLSTDANGFLNPAREIVRREHGNTVDVIALGDSFMEHAHRIFYERFAAYDFHYYNLAIHRQCPPQYNRILERYLGELKPRFVLYGLFENDFAESEDFDNWQASGMDWFAYHSGTWCGPPPASTKLERIRDTWLRGWYAFYRTLLVKVRGERMSVSGPTEEQIARVQQCALEAADRVQQAGAQFIVLIIPSKATAGNGPTLESKAMDPIAAALRAKGVLVLDLRSTFATLMKLTALYYERDSHWNRHGMEIAANAIIDQIEQGTE